MKFIFNLTRRELRSSWRRLLFFFLCIALGVGSVVALRSLIQNLTRVVGNDARALMTADVEVTSTNDFSPTDISQIEGVIGRFPIVEARDENISTAIMARPVDPTNESLEFVELKGIEPQFPLVGNFVLSTEQPFDYKLLENNGAVIAKVLLEELKVKIGDKLRIGEGEFQIRAAFDEEPGGSSGFRMGARVFVEKKAFESAGITRNSRVRRRILYRTSSDPTDLVGQLREALKGTTIQVNSYREQQENLSDNFARMENYLSLTGLLILVLGGVGVWNVARAFVEEKRKTVAILKCLGAGGTRIITVYLLQILVLGILGSLFGVVLAQLGLWIARWRFIDALPAKMSYAVNLSTGFQGVILGVLISLLFSALPLLQIRNIKPKLLLRDENNTNISRLDWIRWGFGAISVLGLLSLAIWQAGSIKVGALFLGGLAATGFGLYVSASLLVWLLKKVKNAGPFSLRQAINSMYRPGNQTRIILLAVGLGAFVVMAVQIMQSNLVREFDFSRNQRLPSLIFVDIQKSQIDSVTGMIENSIGEKAETVATIRGRIAFINGIAIDYQQKEIRQQQGQIGREFALTYRDKLDENETLASGEWWPEQKTDDAPEVSVEENMAKTLKVTPGDSMTFDVSGRQITARVLSIRSIDVRNARTAFVFVFRPGTLEAAPQTFVATVLKQVPATERQRLQRQVLDRFPNVQIFDVADIVATVQRLINNFVLAISFVGSFVLLTGILILIGSVALTKSQRIYENAVLKTLGAKRRTLATILFTEYALLGFLAGVIASGFAVSLSFVVSRYLMEIEWQFDPVLVIAGILTTMVLVTAVGVGASFDVLFRKPLATLKSQ